MFDVKAFVSDLQDYIAGALSPLSRRIEALELALAARPERGPPGEPGVGVAGAIINRHGHLVVTLSNGTAQDLGPVVGRDGFELENFSATYDGERGLTLTFQRGEVRREFVLHLPVVIHRGYWREETQAKAGDSWTHGGSVWIAKRDTQAKPCFEKPDDWTLAVKAGRDGVQGPAGKDYAPPKSVKLKKGSAAHG